MRRTVCGKCGRDSDCHGLGAEEQEQGRTGVRGCARPFGIIQVVCEEGKTDAALLEKAASLRAEYVVALVGTVARRSGAVNDKIATGEIEIIPSELRILSTALTPPFQIEENSKTKEEVRLNTAILT